MNASIVCIVALTLFALGYRFYSRYLSEVVFQLDDSEPTPAHTMADGVDYVAAPRGVLFGHHFSSIAGAAPIVGPAVAVIWGWVPALVWVVLGVITAGAVHDMATLAISLKHQGRSMGDLTAQVIGPRSRLLFLMVILHPIGHGARGFCFRDWGLVHSLSWGHYPGKYRDTARHVCWVGTATEKECPSSGRLSCSLSSDTP